MFNIISYIIFLIICSYITIDVGRRCYYAGKIYLEYLIKDKDFCNTINRILLGCYYLINLGYVALSLTTWSQVNTLEELFTMTLTRIGNILLILCLLHYINILVFYLLRKKITFKS